MVGKGIKKRISAYKKHSKRWKIEGDIKETSLKGLKSDVGSRASRARGIVPKPGPVFCWLQQHFFPPQPPQFKLGKAQGGGFLGQGMQGWNKNGGSMRRKWQKWHPVSLNALKQGK